MWSRRFNASRFSLKTRKSDAHFRRCEITGVLREGFLGGRSEGLRSRAERRLLSPPCVERGRLF